MRCVICLRTLSVADAKHSLVASHAVKVLMNNDPISVNMYVCMYLQREVFSIHQ